MASVPPTEIALQVTVIPRRSAPPFTRPPSGSSRRAPPSVPAARIDALVRYWDVTPAQRRAARGRARALEGSAVRTELHRGNRSARKCRSSHWASTMSRCASASAAMPRALSTRLRTIRPVRTVRSSSTTKRVAVRMRRPSSSREHALQARVYADVLHKAGFAHVTLIFVRVEIPDSSIPTSPKPSPTPSNCSLWGRGCHAPLWPLWDGGGRGQSGLFGTGFPGASHRFI